MRELKFIHITKTAGTSITESGFRSGLNWGGIHREYGSHHEFFPRKPAWLKQKYDWFLVVRNPYERLVSEFHCGWAVREDANKERMALSLRAIREGNKGAFNEILRQRIGLRRDSGGHYAEQWRCMDAGVCVRAIRFENLKTEFDSLMAEYCLGVKLELVVNKSRKAFSVDDMNDKTVGLVNRVYEKDFEYFGYPMRRTKPIL